ncbi:hypothetical protein ACN2XU_20545 [Primorskyibacter sp. 2E107]|uniref:hypothetical protein n=1 Tax=Primorskyibacter sp. 2E107 TaxID=3403458 RepID=UPI003AF80990
MSIQEYAYAGLILPDERGLSIAPYLDSCQQVLARLDPRPVGVPKRSAKRQAVLGHYFGLRVTAEADSDYGPRILIEVITRDGAAPDEETAARLLSDTVLASLEHSHADMIEWFSPDTLLDTADFVRLRNYTSPQRARRAPTHEQDVETAAALAVQELFQDQALCDPVYDLDNAQTAMPSEEQVATQDLRDLLSEDDVRDPKEAYNPLARMKARMAEAEPEEKRLSFAGWLMSGVLAVVFFPAAVFLWITALWRGMDFRLTTQVLSVTILFVALANSNRLHVLLGNVLN